MSGAPESDEDVAGTFLRSSLCSDFVKYSFNEKTVSDSHENVGKLISWRIYIKILFFARCQNRTCSQLLHKATGHPSSNQCSKGPHYNLWFFKPPENNFFCLFKQKFLTEKYTDMTLNCTYFSYCLQYSLHLHTRMGDDINFQLRSQEYHLSISPSILELSW